MVIFLTLFVLHLLVVILLCGRTFPPPTCLLSFKFYISMVSRIFLQLCRLNAFSVINFGAQIVSDVARGSCGLARLAPEAFWHSPSLLEHVLLLGTRCSKLILNFLSASSEINLLFKELLENGISKSRYDRPRILSQVARGCLSEEIASKWEGRQWAMWVPGGRVHLAEERIEQNAEMGRSQVMFEEQQGEARAAGTEGARGRAVKGLVDWSN